MKNKPLMIIIITFIVVLGIILFLIRPVISSVLGSWRDLNTAKLNLTAIQEKEQVFEALKNNQDLTKVADIAEKYIPKQDGSSQLILELNAMATNNNLKIEQTSIEKLKDTPAPDTDETASDKATPASTASASDAPAKSEAKSVDFTMKLNGNYGDILNFLKAVETSSRLIIINNLALTAKTEANQPTSFNVDLTGTAYYKNDISLEPTLDNIKISDETLQTFLDLKSYSQPTNTSTESGFGRTNPFENY